MKISFVVTVLNEEKTIRGLLESLENQTKKPDEIIIVDGGSSDNTLSEISNIKYLASRSPRFGEAGRSGQISNKEIKFHVFKKPNSTIAQARNYGVKKASSNIIAMTDAGCIAHKDWLKKITEPFKRQNADLVAGFYRMVASSPLQKALAVFLGISPKRFDRQRFLPSARSMSFKKTLWQKIGGFNEKLERAGEDTMFNYQALQHGAKIVRVKEALVDWEVPKTLSEGFKKFYIYAKGDVQAGIWWHPTQRISTHNLKIFSIFLRYAIGLILVVLYFSTRSNYFLFSIFYFLFLYLLWSIWKMRDVVTDTKVRLWIPVVQLLSDAAVILGATLGLIKSDGR